MSYLLRTLFDFFYGFGHSDTFFSGYMVEALSGIPFDLLPITIVLFYHRINLRKFKNGKE